MLIRTYAIYRDYNHTHVFLANIPARNYSHASTIAQHLYGGKAYVVSAGPVAAGA